MVRSVAKYLLIALIIILILAWFLGGGLAKIQSAAGNFGFSGLWSGISPFALPWAVPIPQGPDISNLANNGQQLSQYSQQQQSQTFGNQSPYSNDITLTADGASASNPELEYVVIQNTGSETVAISGWSLQSAFSGARGYIPLGASFFEVGQLNEQSSIELYPGGVAIVTSGESPVGTSFRENECSGYLEQLQHFTPPMQTQCPSPSNDASEASVYGQSCSQYVDSVPFCTLPLSFPQGISASCEIYAQSTFSYDGCVAQYQNGPNFALNDWRIYLNGDQALWNSSHDTIRLLDSEGQIVSVASY